MNDSGSTSNGHMEGFSHQNNAASELPHLLSSNQLTTSFGNLNGVINHSNHPNAVPPSRPPSTADLSSVQDHETPVPPLEILVTKSEKRDEDWHDFTLGQSPPATPFSLLPPGNTHSYAEKRREKKTLNFFGRAEKNVKSHSQPHSTRGEEFWKSAFLGKHLSRVFFIKVEELLEDDIIIAVMGPTGAGKSSFIRTATGADIAVGDDLESCTTDIQIVRFKFVDINVVFVDTPGFDDTHTSDVDILKLIAEWLNTTYKRNIKLSGLLYFHRISDNRMAGTPLKNLRMFQELCGRNALQNIILTTTMWAEVETELGSQREKELETNYWNAMISEGSKTFRFLNTRESAWAILDYFLQPIHERQAVQLQKEMVDLERQLSQTKAGKQLYGELQTIVKNQQRTLQKIREETKRHGQSEVLLQALKDEHETLRKELGNTVEKMQTLKISLGKRFRSILSFSLPKFGR